MTWLQMAEAGFSPGRAALHKGVPFAVGVAQMRRARHVLQRGAIARVRNGLPKLAADIGKVDLREVSIGIVSGEAVPRDERRRRIVDSDHTSISKAPQEIYHARREFILAWRSPELKVKG